jgi:hypothetical protein
MRCGIRSSPSVCWGVQCRAALRRCAAIVVNCIRKSSVFLRQEDFNILELRWRTQDSQYLANRQRNARVSVNESKSAATHPLGRSLSALISIESSLRGKFSLSKLFSQATGKTFSTFNYMTMPRSRTQAQSIILAAAATKVAISYDSAFIVRSFAHGLTPKT